MCETKLILAIFYRLLIVSLDLLQFACIFDNWCLGFVLYIGCGLMICFKVSFYPSQVVGWEDHLQNDLLCVQWEIDATHSLTYSVFSEAVKRDQAIEPRTTPH